MFDKIFRCNNGDTLRIIKYLTYDEVTVQFENGFILNNISLGNIKKGYVKNPTHPSVEAIGYLGQGKYKCYDSGKATTEYACWKNLLHRCYCLTTSKKYSSYKGCTVDECWHNFQNFAKWFEHNYKEGYELDKDILFKGNKVYSPETCCFVPSEINTLLITCKGVRGEYPIGVFRHSKNRFRVMLSTSRGRIDIGLYQSVEEAFQAYKVAKEKYIKEVADEYKDQIEPKIYQALISYNIEITD